MKYFLVWCILGVLDVPWELQLFDVEQEQVEELKKQKQSNKL